MPAQPSADAVQIIQGAPVLHVGDVKAIAGWFRDVLGFTWDFGDESYAVVWRDNSAVHFVKSEHEHEPSGVHLFLWVRDADACHADVAARGETITSAPGDQPYGLREFSVVAPNGLSVVFGQDLD